MPKPKVEWRITCAQFGKGRRHRSHAWERTSLPKAEKAAIDNAELAARVEYRQDCEPWKIQTRVIPPWGDHEQEVTD